MTKEEYRLKCKELCDKYRFNYINGRSWGIYTRIAREQGFINGKDEFENVENYFIYCKEIEKKNKEFELEIENCKKICDELEFEYKSNMGIINYINNAKKQNKTIYQYISEKVQEQKDEEERQKEINLCEELCKKYGLKFGNRIKSYARYKKEADLRNISLKDYITIKGEEKLEKERIEKYHKEFCEKYNVSYTSEYSWGNYIKEAQKINITPEEYIIIKSKENQENIDIRNKIIELCQKYSFPYDKPSYFGGYIGAAIKVNLSLEEYFKIIKENLDKEEKSINDCKELCKKYNLPFINNSSYGNYKREAESRNMNLNDYLIFKGENKLKEEKEIKERNELLEKYGFNYFYLRVLINNANKKNLTLEEYMGTFVWCDHCQQYEDPDFNSISNHWEEKDKNEFFIYRIWKDDHSEDVSFLESNIVGFDKLLDNKIHCGIYRWYIDSIPFYYGQSINILRRSHEHFINIIDSSEYWLNIYEEMKNNNDNNISNNKIHTLSIDFVECNENELDSLEKKLILRDKPMTQICTNDNKYDNIIPLNQRDFNLENLKDKYEERIKYY